MQPHRPSTRVVIVEQALRDIFERLDELDAASPRSRELRARAFGYRRAVERWAVDPPSLEQREAMTRVVLELSVEVHEMARDTKR